MDGTFRAHKSGRASVLEGRLRLGGPRVVLGRPRAYMNESGGPGASLLSFYKLTPQRVGGGDDELGLPVGTLGGKIWGGGKRYKRARALRAAPRGRGVFPG